MTERIGHAQRRALEILSDGYSARIDVAAVVGPHGKAPAHAADWTYVVVPLWV